MTNGSNDRLDRIERLIEALGQRTNSNCQAIAANSAAIAGINATLAILQQLLRDRNGNSPQA